MRKLILAVLAVAFLAMPAYASVQNVRVSGSIDSFFVYRENFEFGNSQQSDEQQQLFITLTGLQVSADLSDRVSAVISLLNERPWDWSDEGDDENKIAIQEAYVTLREMLYSPLTIVVGRQRGFSLGNSLVYDATGTNNQATSQTGIDEVADLSKLQGQDLVRAILDYSPLTLNIFAARINQDSEELDTDAFDDVNVYGIDAVYELGDEMNSLVEAYLIAKKDRTAESSKKADVVKVVGIRGSTTPIEGLNLQLEYAHQSGTYIASGTNVQSRDAHAVQAIVNYDVPILTDYNPVLQYVFTKVTGEDSGNSTDDDYTAWDPMYENQGGGTIYNTLFNLSNLVIHEASLTANPMEDVTTKVRLVKLWQMERTPNTSFTLIQPDGDDKSLTVNASERSLGWEVDLEALYDYTEDVQIGLLMGWFFPGEIFKQRNAAKQVLLNLSVLF